MKEAFARHFQTEPEVQSTAPGRINLIGEHTDYNEGFVLPGAIDKQVSFLLALNPNPQQCRVHAIDVGETMTLSLNELQPLPAGGWKNYVIGVVAEMIKAGGLIKGFDAVFSGDVPLGAGLSSSAALECALAAGLNHLFALGFSKLELARVAQMAEHHYAGVQCGIMDQFASMMGKRGRVIRLDCRTLEYEYRPLRLLDYELVLLNSGVHHSLADSAYNERRAECEQGVSILKNFYPQIRSLRDVHASILEKHQEALSETIFNRCEHVVRENLRVRMAAHALEADNLIDVGIFMYESHDSLAKLYEVSCPELDFLVDYGRPLKHVLGARMMGGGFGGCTLNLVRRHKVPEFIEEISQAYYSETGIILESYNVSPQDGAKAWFVNPESHA